MTIYAYQYEFNADVEKTKASYKGYGERTTHCECENCAFYQADFIQRSYPFFEMLKSMGVDLSRDQDALYILDEKPPYQVRIFGNYKFSGVLEYNDDHYFPVTSSGTRATTDIKEEHPDYSASFRFVQSKADEITVEFAIRAKRFF